MRNLYKAKVRISVPYSNAKTKEWKESEGDHSHFTRPIRIKFQVLLLGSNALGYSFNRLSIFSNFPFKVTFYFRRLSILGNFPLLADFYN